ncbi:MAG: hypothetical protein ABIU09_10280 [Pyrinomonadaceae bacterium]
MSKVVVSYGADANRWARQYCRTLPWTRGPGMPAATGTRRVEVVSRMTREGIVASVEQAARGAGAGGEVIYSIGHGNSAAVGATVQLGVGSELTLTQDILRSDAEGRYGDPAGPTGRVTLSSADQAINLAFRQIGAALVRHRVARFTFLVCVLGNNRTFLQAIKTAWGGTIEVAGYTAYVGTQEFTMTGDPTYPRVSLYLSRDQNGTQVISGTAVEPRCFLELPEDRHLTAV